MAFNSSPQDRCLRILVRHAATLAVVAFDTETDIHLARRTLLEQRISGAPVVNENGQLLGMLTVRDFLSFYRQDGNQ